MKDERLDHAAIAVGWDKRVERAPAHQGKAIRRQASGVRNQALEPESRRLIVLGRRSQARFSYPTRQSFIRVPLSHRPGCFTITRHRPLVRLIDHEGTKTQSLCFVSPCLWG
jgi:hypothetical protein